MGRNDDALSRKWLVVERMYLVFSISNILATNENPVNLGPDLDTHDKKMSKNSLVQRWYAVFNCSTDRSCDPGLLRSVIVVDKNRISWLSAHVIPVQVLAGKKGV